MDKEKLAKTILEQVGGKENVENLVHCVTRLRFTLKDESKAQTDFLSKQEGVASVIASKDSNDNQYQVVVGTLTNDIYDSIKSAL